MADLLFPPDEYQARVAALQAAMVQADLSALLLTSAADIFYVSGFLTRFWESPARPWFVLVPAQGAPIAVIPAIGEWLMRQHWLTDIRTWDAPHPTDDGVSLLSAAINEIVPQGGTLGLPMGLETQLRMPLADYARLCAAIAPRQIGDATDVVQRVREIKSEAEISKIRTSCKIADAAFAQVSKMARTGVPLERVFRSFQMALLDQGADWVSYLAGAAGPGGYSDVISPATARPLQQGDVLMLDTGAVKDGYFCDFDRNFAVGQVSADVHRVHEALYRATDTALERLVPGMRACDLHRLLSEDLAARGVTPGGGRLGHGLGLTLTEWPSLTPLDQTELRVGMVLTLEPSAFVEADRLLVHEENLVLRESGAELLSPRAPARLPMLE